MQMKIHVLFLKITKRGEVKDNEETKEDLYPQIKMISEH